MLNTGIYVMLMTPYDEDLKQSCNKKHKQIRVFPFHSLRGLNLFIISKSVLFSGKCCPDTPVRTVRTLFASVIARDNHLILFYMGLNWGIFFSKQTKNKPNKKPPCTSCTR